MVLISMGLCLALIASDRDRNCREKTDDMMLQYFAKARNPGTFLLSKYLVTAQVTECAAHRRNAVARVISSGSIRRQR
jgi:hypothetical protein